MRRLRSLSGELIENQIFGHVSGAFTGATTRRDGLIAEADGGTLFFDEVDSHTGEMSGCYP